MTAVVKSETPITDAFEDRVANGDERRAPLVYPLSNKIDYCAAYGEAIEKMAELEGDRRKLIEALRNMTRIVGPTPMRATVDGEQFHAAMLLLREVA